jgi:anti-sigma B factor antagonist
MPDAVATVPTPLLLRSFVQQEATVVRCTGDLTSSNAALLKTFVKGALPDTKRVILDLTNLTRMDSSGLGAIVGLYISAKNAGRALELVNLSPRVRELFGLTNLLSVFETCGRYGTRLP